MSSATPESGRALPGSSVALGGLFRRAAPLATESFRPDIEGLRGIAVLLVVGYHTRLLGFQGGFIGVDVFFVLSGYLITRLLATEVQRSGHLDFANFYARRVRRLLPAINTTVLLTLIVGALVFSPLEQVEFARTARATALYAANIFFVFEATDYFGGDLSANPLLHTWSLAVEEQFYLVWPLIVWFGFRRRHSRRALAPTLVVVSLASFVMSVWL